MRSAGKCSGSCPWAAFSRDASGTIAIKFALMVPVLLGFAAGGVEYSLVSRHKAIIQAAADAGSVAAAKEMGLVDIKTENVDSVVKAVVENYIAANAEAEFANGTLDIETVVRSDPLEVDVTATQRFETPFAGFGLDVAEVTARSVARIVGQPNICVLGLDPDESGTISLETRAKVTGNDCAVFSNSTSPQGIRAKNGSALSANVICSRGGSEGGHGNFSPDPISDCPGFDDPLADRPEPDVGPCLETDLKISDETRTLFPGTYCGGLTVTKDSKVTLKPGVYVFKDGELKVDGDSSFEGEEVGLFFTGDKATFNFKAKSSISLTAPTDGPMAGLLTFESRAGDTNGKHLIESEDARVLLGTLYLPRSELRVDAESTIADRSAYTAIVARTMRLYGGPHLVLNARFEATDVPVPEGIRGTAQPIALVR